VLVVHQSRNRIDLNRSSHEKPLYENLGWANRLTILRGGLIAMVGGFLLMDWPETFVGWIPGILYTLAAIIDRLDGYIARKSARTSLLGIELDTVFDALGLAIAPLLAVFYGQIHWSYLLFGSAWYLFQWGIFRRRQKNLPVYKLAPNITRRAWAGFQMGFIGIVLFPVFSPPFTTVCGIAFMLPVLTGFMIDWLVVSGHIDRQNPETDKFFRTSWHLIQSGIQPLLRVLLSLIIVSLLGLPETVGEAFALLLTLMLLAGFVGRTVALVLLGLAGVYYQYQVFDLMAYVLTCSLVWLLLLGTGSFSLSRADENWIHRYDGA
jgi:CDP-diacylglycerol--glycerol-3-phosphate 3-phosphatidyltransferase